jgi:NAD+ synthase (glutamine-hydrolysing)
MGAIAPIANLPKTAVIYLLNYLLGEMGLDGIRATLEIPASAELAPDQEDEKDLMPFPVLDACFTLFAGEKMDLEEIKEVLIAMFPDFDPNQLSQWVAKFITLFHQNIFKWVQSPLSIHLGTLDLDRERALQFPVVSKPQWTTG